MPTYKIPFNRPTRLAGRRNRLDDLSDRLRSTNDRAGPRSNHASQDSRYDSYHWRDHEQCERKQVSGFHGGIIAKFGAPAPGESLNPVGLSPS